MNRCHNPHLTGNKKSSFYDTLTSSESLKWKHRTSLLRFVFDKFHRKYAFWCIYAIKGLTLLPLSYVIYFFTYLKFFFTHSICVSLPRATTSSARKVLISFCLIWDQTFSNLHVYHVYKTHIEFLTLSSLNLPWSSSTASHNFKCPKSTHIILFNLRPNIFKSSCLPCL